MEAPTAILRPATTSGPNARTNDRLEVADACLEYDENAVCRRIGVECDFLYPNTSAPPLQDPPLSRIVVTPLTGPRA